MGASGKSVRFSTDVDELVREVYGDVGRKASSAILRAKVRSEVECLAAGWSVSRPYVPCAAVALVACAWLMYPLPPGGVVV